MWKSGREFKIEESMKILHMCESLARGGGIASFISDITSAQVLHHNVTIGLINKQTKEYRINIAKDVKVVEFGKLKAGFSIKYPIHIYNYIKKSKFDIVHVHSSFLYYALSVILLHKFTKFVYTIHSDAVQENASRWDRMFFWLKKMCFQLGWMHPVTLSNASKKSFDDLYGMDSKLIPNGIRRCEVQFDTNLLDQYRYTSNTRVFYHPGRISEAKNQVVLCEAFRQLILDGQDVVLLISGTKQDIHIYSQLENYFSDRIVYLGERKDVLELLNEADAMCLPSKWEGMPIVLLEALSVGCLSICAPVGGIPEIIQDGYNGLLASSSNLDDYIESLCRYLYLSKETIAKMKAHAKNTFDEYTIEKCSSKYCRFYESLLNGK